MKRIHLLTTNDTPNALAFNYPLQIHKSLLQDINLDINLFFRIKPSLFDCDILMVNSKNFRTLWNGRSVEIFEFLTSAKTKVCTILWCDTADSTGTPQFGVIPYVDGYYKTSVLKNRMEYLNNYLGHRYFTNFYYKRYEIEPDNITASFPPISKKDLNKIYVSWSSAMGDYGRWAKWHEKIRSYIFFPRWYSAKFISPNKTRPNKISCRVGLTHRNSAVRLHRQMTIQKLQNFYKIPTSKISYKVFLQELQNAKIGVSPFGWGEIAYRDFETIINGAALVKPNMSHVDTWPPLYQPEKTYIPYDWDMSNLTSKLDQWLTNESWKDIAHNAQKMYYHYLFEPDGHYEFCQHFKTIVMRHLDYNKELHSSL